MSVIPISPGTVKQRTLREYIRLRNRRLRIQKEEREIAKQIMQVLLDGGVVEPGTHDAEVDVCHCGEEQVCRLTVR